MIDSDATARPAAGKWPLLNDAIVVAVITFAGYVTSFIFQLGYCSVYKIPPELIGLTLTGGLAITGPLLYAAAFWFGIFFVMIAWFRNVTEYEGRILRYPLIIGAIVLLWACSRINFFWYFLLLTLFAITSIAWLYALRVRGSKEIERITTHPDHPSNIDSAANVVFRLLGHQGTFFLIMILVVTSMIYASGELYAATHRVLPLVGVGDRLVLLRIYGDQMITESVTREDTAAVRNLYPHEVIYALTGDIHILKAGAPNGVVRTEAQVRTLLPFEAASLRYGRRPAGFTMLLPGASWGW